MQDEVNMMNQTEQSRRPRKGFTVWHLTEEAQLAQGARNAGVEQLRQKSWKKSREHPDEFGKPKPKKSPAKSKDHERASAKREKSAASDREADVIQQPKEEIDMGPALPDAAEIAKRQLVETKERFFP